MNKLDGILLVDKPKGWTSFDVVAKVRGSLKKAGVKVKVGHTGTLDPMATGLLVLLIGSYTKKAGELTKLDKVYEAEITLGATSTTGDSEGELTKVSDSRPGTEEIAKILQSLTGEIEQVPPAYSAIKVDGQRAYKLARAGKEVKIQPRQVQVYSLHLTEYSYPNLKVTAHVSSGTYIRTLAEDIGKKLGTGAYLGNLRRITVGKYRISEAITFKEMNIQKIDSALLTLEKSS